jgi:hypothetical protein
LRPVTAEDRIVGEEAPMELKLTRTTFTEDSTIGELRLNGVFECYTLEDRVRDVKIAGRTAIPAGRYEVVINESPRFKRLMPLLLNVPNYEGVRIHTGNKAEHTEGCLLVGQRVGTDQITSSRAAYGALFDKLMAAKGRGDTIWIEIETELDKLAFDGRSLIWYRRGAVHKQWPATSGRAGYQSKAFQMVKDKGPLPSGKWLVLQKNYQKMPPRDWIERIAAELGRTAWPGGKSSWGQHRIWLTPAAGTATHGRSGFSIHGGSSPGSAGCIDLTHWMPAFASEFVGYGKDMELTVA